MIKKIYSEKDKEILEMAETENDSDTVNGIISDLSETENSIATYEFERMFSGEMDRNSAYLDIQSGSGGTEAQDWAEMILRMYLRWGDKHNFKVKLMEVSAGEVAGIKSATIHFDGDYAFGWLRSEIGIHRLVRKSPYNANGKITMQSYKPNNLVYETDAPENGFAVFSEIYYPKGWNAYVDGNLTPHTCVNYILRGMEIPAGKHKVEFKFEPQVYKTGNSIALIGSILLLLVVGTGLFLAKKKNEIVF